MNPLEITVAVCSIVGVIIAGIWLHISTVNNLKETINDLKTKCEGHATKDALKDLELKMKDLEKKDELQQQTIDQLNALFPDLKKALEAIASQKKR